MLSNFLCVARNLEKKTFVPRDKNDQICTTALYKHGYILWVSYAFKVCSKSVPEIRYIWPVIVVGAVITHKMFDAGTKHLSAIDGQLKVFLGPCRWRNSIFKSPLYIFTSVNMPTFMYIHFSQYANTADIRKTHLFLWSMICWNQIVETLYPHFWICKQLCCKILVKNGGNSFSRHGLWLCKAILQVSTNIDYFFLTYTKKCDGRNFCYA